MTFSDAIARLIEYAIQGASDSERLHVFDAIASLGQHVAAGEKEMLRVLAARAADVAASLRTADGQQLLFRELLSSEMSKGGDGK